jgi:hypothetical protein
VIFINSSDQENSKSIKKEGKNHTTTGKFTKVKIGCQNKKANFLLLLFVTPSLIASVVTTVLVSVNVEQYKSMGNLTFT